jgi:hypothetical protein
MSSIVEAGDARRASALSRLRVVCGHITVASNAGSQSAAVPRNVESILRDSRAVSLSSTAAAGRTIPCLTECDDDVVIVSALRTPICKSRRGGFKVCFNVLQISGNSMKSRFKHVEQASCLI